MLKITFSRLAIFDIFQNLVGFLTYSYFSWFLTYLDILVTFLPTFLRLLSFVEILVFGGYVSKH